MLPKGTSFRYDGIPEACQIGLFASVHIMLEAGL